MSSDNIIIQHIRLVTSSFGAIRVLPILLLPCLGMESKYSGQDNCRLYNWLCACLSVLCNLFLMAIRIHGGIQNFLNWYCHWSKHLSLLASNIFNKIPFCKYTWVPVILPFFKYFLEVMLYECVQHCLHFSLDHHNYQTSGLSTSSAVGGTEKLKWAKLST